MRAKPTILLASMGGTIATRLDSSGRHVVSADAADLSASFPELAELASVATADVCRLPSHAVGPTDHLHAVRIINEWILRGVSGIVITHGTDTIEETAYSLALQIPRGTPIVLTGAMRAPDTYGADGPANLLAAFRLAMTPLAGRLGPVVVFQDELHLARWVTKVSTARAAAFASPGVGPVGEVVEGIPRIAMLPAEPDYIGAPTNLDMRVEILWAAAGASGQLVRAAASNADGLVVAGTGGGHLPDDMADACLEVVQGGTPVILASRTGTGTVLQSTYGGSRGSETDLIAGGLIPAGWLSPVKARLRLLTALALGMEAHQVFPV